MMLRTFSALALAAMASGLLVSPALAQPAPADSQPGIAMLLPQAPVSPVEAAKALEKRTEVANAKLPVYPQAVKEIKHSPPGAPVQPAAPKPPGAPSAPTPH